MKYINKLICASSILALSGAVQAKSPMVGDIIDAANVDEYKEYILDSTIELIKMGLVQKVTETSAPGALDNAEYMALSRKNDGKAKILDEYGTIGLEDGSPWIGGIPFLKPKSGIEVMQNYQVANIGLQGDDWSSPKGVLSPLNRLFYVDASGEVYKNLVMAGAQINMSARTKVLPNPYIKGYDDELLRRFFVFLEPYDVRGIVTLDIQYQDQSRLPESYVYLPSFRRVRQVSTAQRADAVAGSQMTQSDLSGFSDPLGLWSFKILETKKMLVHTHGSVDVAPYPKVVTFHNGYFANAQRPVELRDVFIIEATPRNPDIIYGKKIMTIDVETFRTSDFAIYDKQGTLYKAFTQDWILNDVNLPRPVWLSIYNLQTKEATLSGQAFLQINQNPSLRFFDKSSMKEASR